MLSRDAMLGVGGASVCCFAIFIVGTGLTAEAICALPSIIFTAVQAWGMQPDSMHSAVATTAAGLRGAFALLSLSAGMVLSSPTWCMSWFSSRSASDSPPAELMTLHGGYTSNDGHAGQ